MYCLLKTNDQHIARSENRTALGKFLRTLLRGVHVYDDGMYYSRGGLFFQNAIIEEILSYSPRIRELPVPHFPCELWEECSTLYSPFIKRLEVTRRDYQLCYPSDISFITEAPTIYQELSTVDLSGDPVYTFKYKGKRIFYTNYPAYWLRLLSTLIVSATDDELLDFEWEKIGWPIQPRLIVEGHYTKSGSNVIVSTIKDLIYPLELLEPL